MEKEKDYILKFGEQPFSHMVISPDCKIDISKAVSVYLGFDSSKPIGTAEISRDEKGLYAKVTAFEKEMYRELLDTKFAEFTFGGTVRKKEGKEIKDFSLDVVSLHGKM